MPQDTLSYVELLSAVREVNRCPGGKRTVRRIATRLGIGSHTRVLEIGSNTGFTSFELVKLTGCQAVGIDVSPEAVAEAQRNAAGLPDAIGGRVSFQVADAGDLPFNDGSFDVIVCGGANTFISDREAAFAEYRRTLRQFGFLSITNLYYESPPPPELRDRLAGVLGFRVPAYGLQEWLALLAPADWEFYDLAVHNLAAREPWVVDAYVESLGLDGRGQLSGTSLTDQWRHVMHVFNDNHRHLSFLELTLRRDDTPEQAELFLMPGRFDPFIERGFVSRATNGG